MKKVFGLTGGIASGKSTVGTFFAKLGVLVLDADELARYVVRPGSLGLQEVVSTFGAEYLLEDGTLDRPKLASLVFSDPEALKKLNAITHPRIRALYEERVREAQTLDTPYVLYEAALLVELGLYKTLDGLVVVAAQPELQVRRVMKRNQLDESAALARVASQSPLAAKLEVADVVILNDDNRAALEIRTREAHTVLLRRAGLTS